MTDVPIRADVPVSIHPENVHSDMVKVLDESATGKAVLQSLREALTSAYTSFAKFKDAEHALDKDAPRVKNGNHTRVVWTRERQGEFVTAAKTEFERIQLTLARRLKELEGYRNGLEKAVAAALDDPANKSPAGIALGSDIRKHVASLKTESERLNFLVAAANRSDKRTLAAVMNAPAYLSGLDEEKHLAPVRMLAATKLAPVEHAQHGATVKAIAQVELAIRNIADLHADAARRLAPDNATVALGALASGEAK